MSISLKSLCVSNLANDLQEGVEKPKCFVLFIETFFFSPKLGYKTELNGTVVSSY